MGNFPFGTGVLQLQASTGVAGFALQNGTPTIVSWAPPNDGNLHRFLIVSNLIVTVATTGGQINVGFNSPTPSSENRELYGPSLGAGFQSPFIQAACFLCMGGGIPVQVNQVSAMSAGAATIWAEIWGI